MVVNDNKVSFSSVSRWSHVWCRSRRFDCILHDLIKHDALLWLWSNKFLPYVKGLSEQLCRCLQQQGVRAVSKSETTLRSQLVRPKDAVDPAKQDGVVYRIPCECSKVECTSERLEDLCKIELRSTIETSDSPVPRPPPFQSMPTTPDTSHSGTKDGQASRMSRSCSLILYSSPMYTLPHSHRILWTMPSCLDGSTASFGRTNWDLSVVSDF